jgi:2-oxopent-4-enoate/cis-2-oxohex-4-enoate hydratase
MPVTATSLPVAELAEELHRARLDRRETATVTSRHPDADLSGAYSIQAAGIELRERDGEVVVGGKLGFTSLAMQQAMGVDQPNYGWLTDAMLVHDRTVALDRLIHPKLEPEIAFLLGDDLDGGMGADDVLAATAAVMPCLEVVDSRFIDFQFQLQDNIADNSSAALVVLGDVAVPPGGLDLRTCGVVISVDGEVAHTATGAAALDDPAKAVAWMADAVSGSRGLRAGDIVISGGLTPPIDLEPGVTIRTDIDHIGTATLRTT